MKRGNWQWLLMVLLLALGGEALLNGAPAKSSVSDLVNGINAFAFNLYSRLKTSGSANIFFSPWSLSSAFAMVYEGARGQTASEIRKVFNFPPNDELRRKSFLQLYLRTNQSRKSFLQLFQRTNQLRTANALWVQKDYPILKSYLDIVRRYYNGNATNLDFVREPEKSRRTINEWVEKQTDGKIKDLLPPGSIKTEPLPTVFVVTNAVYFKGLWLLQFNPKLTREDDFKVRHNKVVRVPMMSLTKAEFPYAETKDLQVLELPYKGEEIAMIILLPKGLDLKPAEEALHPERLKQLVTSLRKTEVDVYLPRFKLEAKYFLAGTLQEMGIKSAFQFGPADFSGIDGKRLLYITDVIHQAYVDVNEEGTEAAAATAIVLAPGAAPTLVQRKIFRADHPFVFLIRDRKTGLILFLGRLVEPQGQS